MKNFRSFILVSIFGSLASCSGLAMANASAAATITVTLQNESEWELTVANGNNRNQTCAQHKTCTYELIPNFPYAIVYSNDGNTQSYMLNAKPQSYAVSCYTAYTYENDKTSPYHYLACWPLLSHMQEK